MTKLAQDRTAFIELLHDTFVIRKGYGAFAYISTTDALLLFNKSLNSGESTERFITQFVKSF